MRRSRHWGLGTLLLCLAAHAQLEVPVAIQLTGDTPAERQVNGLAAPLAGDAAVSAEAARTDATNRAFGSWNGSVLEADVIPPVTAYTAGMYVVVVPDAPSGIEARLSLNGVEAAPVYGLGGTPLEPGALQADIPAQLVFDGISFQLISTGYLPCEPGTTAASRQFCIDDSTSGPLNFVSAAQACSARNARLCSYAEWVATCERSPAFFGTVSDFEWVDDAANSASEGKLVGYGYNGTATDLALGCRRGASRILTDVYKFRCCRSR
ncbi:MAG: hypothetical protein JNM62_03250 [Flavobacteriales bacterium]|nr:hypothetical protein [Flavobacteriales bacterium]